MLQQAGDVTDARDVVAQGLDGKIVTVGAAKDNAGVSGSRSQSDMAVDTGVEADAFGAG